MPFNLLLLPLIAGFWFITRNHLFSYTTSTLAKEAMLLHASLWGLAFLVVSRIAVWTLLQSGFGVAVGETLHSVAPFPFIGTALGALLLSYALTGVLNYLLPATLAGTWCYHARKFDDLETLLLRSGFGQEPTGCPPDRMRLLAQAVTSKVRKRPPPLHQGGHDLQLIMLSLDDDKVYVGYVVNLPPLRADGFEFVRLSPYVSGYRDRARRFIITTYYPVDQLADQNQRFVKVIPRATITSANLFVEGAFQIPEDVGANVGKPAAAADEG